MISRKNVFITNFIDQNDDKLININPKNQLLLNPFSKGASGNKN